MSKGDGRRTENTAQVEANWPFPDPPRRHGRTTVEPEPEIIDLRAAHLEACREFHRNRED